MPAVCRFKFPEGLDREIIETQLALAIIAAECTFGQPKVRISAAYCVSPGSSTADKKKKPQVAIDVSTEVGEHIAQVFTGLMIRQLGEDKFTVDRVTGKE
ncbi:MAG: hypothetical protein Kow00103_13890 [Candidatus Caldatribacteriota bacterium]